MKRLVQLATALFLLGFLAGILAVIVIGTFESWLVLVLCLSGFCFFWQRQNQKVSLLIVDKNQGGIVGWFKSLVDFFASIFAVLLFVFVLRSFMFEPFRIPSGSMIPTLHIGDFVLVNKASYGIRLPIVGWKLFGKNDVERGDVAVFRFPENPSIDYIKRIVALPGDRVTIVGKKIMINDQLLFLEFNGDYDGSQVPYVGSAADEYTEKNGDKSYEILWFKNNFLNQSTTFKVPSKRYFVMGDNRNNSNDSRFWGFVPEDNLKGRAFFVWLNWDDEINFERFGINL